MLKPLKQFVCDTCKTLIEEREKGWLEFIWEDPDTRPRQFRIVHHHPDCHQYTHTYDRADLHLHQALRDKQPPQLLKAKKHPSIYSPFDRIDGSDISNFIQTAKRLRIPYYEEARLYWDEAIRDDMFKGMTNEEIYSAPNLKAVIKKYSVAPE